MTENRNRLPVAVDVVSGGDASGRTGSVVLLLNGIGSGSFDLGTATRFRLLANLRASLDSTIALIGYTSPVTLANTEYVLRDYEDVRDSVPPGTTIYFRLVDAMTMELVNGNVCDYLVLTKYQ